MMNKGQTFEHVAEGTTHYQQVDVEKKKACPEYGMSKLKLCILYAAGCSLVLGLIYFDRSFGDIFGVMKKYSPFENY